MSRRTDNRITVNLTDQAEGATNPGHDSVTRGSCGTGNIDLIWWAARDNQFVTRNHLVTRLHCLSVTRCNS